MVAGQPPLVVGRAKMVAGQPPLVLGRAKFAVGRPPPVVGRAKMVAGRPPWAVGRETWLIGRPPSVKTPVPSPANPAKIAQPAHCNTSAGNTRTAGHPSLPPPCARRSLPPAPQAPARRTTALRNVAKTFESDTGRPSAGQRAPFMRTKNWREKGLRKSGTRSVFFLEKSFPEIRKSAFIQTVRTRPALAVNCARCLARPRARGAAHLEVRPISDTTDDSHDNRTNTESVRTDKAP